MNLGSKNYNIENKKEVSLLEYSSFLDNNKHCQLYPKYCRIFDILSYIFKNKIP